MSGPEAGAGAGAAAQDAHARLPTTTQLPASCPEHLCLPGVGQLNGPHEAANSRAGVAGPTSSLLDLLAASARAACSRLSAKLLGLDDCELTGVLERDGTIAAPPAVAHLTGALKPSHSLCDTAVGRRHGLDGDRAQASLQPAQQLDDGSSQARRQEMGRKRRRQWLVSGPSSLQGAETEAQTQLKAAAQAQDSGRLSPEQGAWESWQAGLLQQGQLRPLACRPDRLTGVQAQRTAVAAAASAAAAAGDSGGQVHQPTPKRPARYVD